MASPSFLPVRPAVSGLGLPLRPQPWATREAGEFPGLNPTVHSHLGDFIVTTFVQISLKRMGLSASFVPFFPILAQ